MGNVFGSISLPHRLVIGFVALIRCFANGEGCRLLGGATKATMAVDFRHRGRQRQCGATTSGDSTCLVVGLGVSEVAATQGYSWAVFYLVAAFGQSGMAG
jgi:hypothetical protein